MTAQTPFVRQTDEQMFDQCQEALLAAQAGQTYQFTTQNGTVHLVTRGEVRWIMANLQYYERRIARARNGGAMRTAQIIPK